MSLQIGIIGLPNCGKSTLFNALTRSHLAPAENYPFCTIDPNVGVVEVPDERLQKLAEITRPQKKVPAVVEFVDIAGLVKGAHKGEGLGNQFLSHIRNCDAIAEVVRFFSDANVIHVHGKVNPKEDIDVIQAELILADLQTVDKRLADVKKKSKSHDRKILAELEIIEKLKSSLQSGQLASDILSPLHGLPREESRGTGGGATDIISPLPGTGRGARGVGFLPLLTLKPLLFIANVDESQLAGFDVAAVKNQLRLGPKDELIPVCAKTEAELADFTQEEAKGLLDELGLKESGLNALIHSAYRLLGLHTYFTVRSQEAHAWTIPIGAKAPEAAGKVHTDFEKGFIKAEVIAYKDYIAAGTEAAARERGLMRQEGREYVVQDGDVIHFRFNV